MKKFLLITVCLALIFFFSLRIKGDLQMYQLLIDESEGLAQTNSSLTKEKEKLEQLLEEGKREEALEQTARLMLGLKKEGEEVIMVLPPKDSSDSELHISTSSNSLSEEPSNFLFSKITQIWYNLIEKFKK
ncbi:MAG TPA: septum formation initiator family protein [Candidatus Paceibacterota bacterium]|nr:septum formation initiator family protein [Candidatus Paceibacterota bacterium]